MRDYMESLDGVLGGYGRVTPMDVRDSNNFIDRLGPAHKFLVGYDMRSDCIAGF